MDADASREVARVFDRWAEEGRDEGMAERHGLSARPVLASLDLDPSDRFLDLGAGNAWAAAWAQAVGARAVAVDVSPRMLQAARERHGAGVGATLASFEALPFPDACFRFAFSVEALYYARDLDRALREATRVLEPGGQLHTLVDYYEGNPASRDWPEETGVRMHRLDPAGWRDALARAGLEAVASQRVRSSEAEDWRAEHGSLHVRGTRA